MDAKSKRQIILLSILLHILFLSFWESAIKLDLSQDLPPPTPSKSAPLVLDLEEPELPREVIATPADARTTPKPQKADFLSDKNALARNQELPPDLRLSADPFSRGEFSSHDLPPRPANPEKQVAADLQEETPANPEKNQASASEELANDEAAEATRPNKPEAASKTKKPFQLQLPGVPHDNRASRVPESGGLSFNTYDWDFAPYMLELKNRISRNIFPPLAFSRLGMIDGDTLLRFKIYPNGELRDLELLQYIGHHSLMETSRLAVTASAPFPDLPADFPKPYLEVTAQFSYFIKK
jgi:hypothetical protein